MDRPFLQRPYNPPPQPSRHPLRNSRSKAKVPDWRTRNCFPTASIHNLLPKRRHGEHIIVYTNPFMPTIPNSLIQESRITTLIDHGDPHGHSSIAKLVGTPCGIAAKLVLDGTIEEKGIVSPVTWRTAEPLLEGLKEYGIQAHTERCWLSKHEFESQSNL